MFDIESRVQVTKPIKPSEAGFYAIIRSSLLTETGLAPYDSTEPMSVLNLTRNFHSVSGSNSGVCPENLPAGVSAMEPTEEQAEFLAECEGEFECRYTEKDEDYRTLSSKSLSKPPIVKQQWDSHQRGGADHRDHRGGYNNYNRGRDSRPWRGGGYNSNRGRDHDSRPQRGYGDRYNDRPRHDRHRHEPY